MSNVSEEQYQILIKKASQKIAAMQPIFDRLHEPIAIIGMGCRFPKANNLEEYWELLSQGKSGIQDRPEFHSYIDQYFDDDLLKNDRIYTKRGGFLEQHPAAFDAAFFKISAIEAASMDPQHRLILEVVWEALEDAGVPPNSLSGSNTGVFMGICSNDYAWKLVKQETDKIDIYLGSGNAYSPVSGRVSYLLDIHGPSLAIDTACSSSLTSTHVAINSIRIGECDIAIVGGIQRYLSPEYWMNLCKSRILSPDGTCKSFSDDANGYVRGEGCGVIVLKRLSQAKADNDRIHAIIPGSATRQDGKTSGLTVPNGASQQEAIKAALKNAGLTIDDIDYLEAHGTATPIGDPIEINAIGNLFKKRKKDLLVGTVKSNIGHLEGSAGLAGLIKVVLALKNKKIPKNLHFSSPSKKIAWSSIPVKVVTELTDWNVSNSKPRTAGVSSFGFEGVNTHVILQEYNETLKPSYLPYMEKYTVILSAKSKASLDTKIRQYIDFLEKNTGLSIADIAFTTNCKREHYKYRLSIVSSSIDDLLLKLRQASNGQVSQNIYFFDENIKNQGIAFLFTGQGSQYLNMGKELYLNNKFFREMMIKCNEIILDKKLLNESILDIMYDTDDLKGQKLLQMTLYTQPALFILEYSLFILLKQLGIEPNVVLGHSVGEYVAACVSGIYSLEDALTLIVHRSRLMQELPQDGMMVAININEEKAKRQIGQIKNKSLVSIAAVNGPSNVVLSGEKKAVKEVVTCLEKEKGVHSMALQTSHAFHSQLMEPMLNDFRKVAEKINYKQPTITFISNITGKKEIEKPATPEYWCDHILRPVYFYQSMLQLKEYSDILLEVGPDSILTSMSKTYMNSRHNIISSVLQKNIKNYDSLARLLAQLYANGINIKWKDLYHEHQGPTVSLPTYPWERKHYWVD